MIERTIKIFVDFDGTITLEDVGEAIFKKFGETEKVKRIIENLLSDKISSRQCWDELCDSVDIINKVELDEFIDLIDVDPTFISFVKLIFEWSACTVLKTKPFSIFGLSIDTSSLQEVIEIEIMIDKNKIILCI